MVGLAGVNGFEDGITANTLSMAVSVYVHHHVHIFAGSLSSLPLLAYLGKPRLPR